MADYFGNRYFAGRYFEEGFFGVAVISGFPTQYLGLRVYDGAVIDLCLVAVADAPSGDMPRLQKNGTTYAIYLVDTTDPDASTVRMQTNDGTKAIRLYT